jgi:hypothetical protein
MKVLNKFYGLDTIVSTTESVEMEKYKVPQKPGHYFPGASIYKPFGGASNKNIKINTIKMCWNKMVGRIPKPRAYLLNPVQVAFDTITIARKPLQGISLEVK